MRRIDHRGELLDAVHAEIGDRRRAALVFLGLEPARPGAGGVVLHLPRDRGERLRLGLADHRRDQPAGNGDGDADVGVFVLEHAGFGPGHVGVGHPDQRQRHRLDDEVVDRELPGRLAVGALGRGGVDVLARRQQLVDGAGDREVEMRDRLLRQHQALGDDLAHVVVGHDLVGAGLEQRADLVVGRRLHRSRRGCRRRRPQRGARSAAPPDFAASTSRAMMRPCGPEPAMRPMSMPAALARRRASGEAKMRPAWPLVAGAGAVAAGGLAGAAGAGGTGAGGAWRPARRQPRGGGAAAFAGCAAGAAALAGAPAAAAFTSSPSVARIAIGWLTAMSALPSGTRIFASVPSSTASYSMVALSVSISARMSPVLTLSPSFLSHLARLPFSMVGDSAGMRMLIGIGPPQELARAVGGAVRDLHHGAHR